MRKSVKDARTKYMRAVDKAPKALDNMNHEACGGEAGPEPLQREELGLHAAAVFVEERRVEQELGVLRPEGAALLRDAALAQNHRLPPLGERPTDHGPRRWAVISSRGIAAGIVKVHACAGTRGGAGVIEVS